VRWCLRVCGHGRLATRKCQQCGRRTVPRPCGLSTFRGAHREELLNTWIFQCNPDRFDIDGYLATEPSRFVWLVTRYADDLEPGDWVFLYRTGPTAGIIAEAKIIGAPAQQVDAPDAVPFWREDRDDAMKIAMRVPLSLVRVGGNREVLRRDWLREDPVLRELPNLKMANGTNYSIETTHAARLMTLWDRTGHDWARNESVAGPWAYAKTYGQQVSRRRRTAMRVEVSITPRLPLENAPNPVQCLPTLSPPGRSSASSRQRAHNQARPCHPCCAPPSLS
jgi:hypothetical protein